MWLLLRCLHVRLGYNLGFENWFNVSRLPLAPLMGTLLVVRWPLTKVLTLKWRVSGWSPTPLLLRLLKGAQWSSIFIVKSLLINVVARLHRRFEDVVSTEEATMELACQVCPRIFNCVFFFFLIKMLSYDIIYYLCPHNVLPSPGLPSLSWRLFSVPSRFETDFRQKGLASWTRG